MRVLAEVAQLLRYLVLHNALLDATQLDILLLVAVNLYEHVLDLPETHMLLVAQHVVNDLAQLDVLHHQLAEPIHFLPQVCFAKHFAPQEGVVRDLGQLRHGGLPTFLIFTEHRLWVLLRDSHNERGDVVEHLDVGGVARHPNLVGKGLPKRELERTRLLPVEAGRAAFIFNALEDGVELLGCLRITLLGTSIVQVKQLLAEALDVELILKHGKVSLDRLQVKAGLLG